MTVGKVLFNYPISSLDIIGKGSYGKVFLISSGGKRYACKAIQCSGSYTEVKKILTEYFLTKIADVLGVGPQIINYFGYDIVFCKSEALFVLEIC